MDDTTDALIAVFHSSWFDNSWHKVGRLEVMSEGRKLLDLVVITALIMQEKSDEGKQAYGNQVSATNRAIFVRKQTIEKDVSHL